MDIAARNELRDIFRNAKPKKIKGPSSPEGMGSGTTIIANHSTVMFAPARPARKKGAQ